MRIFAYCAREFERQVRWASGVMPRTCPPVNLDSFDPAWMINQDLIYLQLHGLPGQPYLYGDGLQTALSAAQVRETFLDGATVFVGSCWLPESPMLEALLDAGAGAVVAGSGQNYTGRSRPAGVDVLGRWVRLGLQIGLDPDRALWLAKLRVRADLGYAGKADTLGFEIYRGEL